MKTLRTLILIAIAASFLVISSCKKDDDDNTYILKFDNTEYALKSGFLENYGSDATGSVFNVDLYLYSPEVVLHETTVGIDSLSGSGMVIYFEIFTSIETGIASGDYVMDLGESGANGTFDYGIIVTNVDSGLESEIEDGIVSVKKDGSTYEITIKVTDENGKSISGYYKGELKYYDYSVDTKSLKSKKKLSK